MSNTGEMASRLAFVLGLGSAAAACGGRVIFEGSTGSGSGGGNGTTTSAHAGSTTGSLVGSSTVSASSGGSCNVPGPPNDQLQHACFTVGATVCPTIQNPDTKTKAQAALNAGQAGCSLQTVDLVACGPDSATGTCCYWVYAHHNCVMGRPFSIEGEARIAAVVARADWSSGAAPSVDGLGAEDRARLAEAWARDAAIEHASVASFARFTLELVAVGAPAELVRLAQAAMGDEIRHAERAFGIASAYAGEALGPAALRVDDARLGRSLAEVVEATIREGCVNETIAALVAAEARDAAEDLVVKAALTEIAADEARHAELAWRAVGWAVRVGGAEIRAAARAAFASALSAIEVGDVESSRSEEGGALRRHGQLGPADKARVARAALGSVLRPISSALLVEAPARDAELSRA